MIFSNSFKELVKLLEEKGANVSAKNKQGNNSMNNLLIINN